MKQKNYILTLLAALMVLVSHTSCSKEETTTSTDDHCYISSFSLGMLKRDVHVVSSAGADSTFRISFSGSYFPMIINNRKMTIENVDSMPIGTLTNAALANISFTGSAVYYRYQTAAEWFEYHATDSINFSAPIEFAVHPYDGSSPRIYTVRVNVHKQDGDAFSWLKLEDSDLLTAFVDAKLTECDGKLYLLGTLSDGTMACAWRGTDASSSWTLQAVAGADKAEVATLCSTSTLLLMSTSQGALLASDDGINWSEMCAPSEGRRLIGLSHNRIYATVNGKIISSSDGGVTWTTEKMDDEAAKLPTAKQNLTVCEQPNGYTRLLLVGETADNTNGHAEVWSKAWRVDANEASTTWMYYSQASDNAWLCPIMSPLFVFSYSDGILAFGGASQDGKYQALERMLLSSDYGLTWKPSNFFVLPSALKGTTSPIYATLDEEDFIWIVAGNTTYRGRLNKLGFK